MKKPLSLILLLALISLSLTACGGGKAAEAAELKFADSTDFETIKSLDGKAVTITGYMATLSPLSGDYIYLMNMPYQSCPFCVPNSQQLANTMAVYAAKGVKFEFTDRPVKISGTMKIEDYTDEYGYFYNYRIVDAKYETVDLSQISEAYALYQSLAADGVTAEINSMFNYLMFLCSWTDYTGSATDENGNPVSYYLYPGDAEEILKMEAPYGYAAEEAEDYFPGLVKKVQAVSSTGLEDLVSMIEEAQDLAVYARGELAAGNYSYDAEADQYRLDAAETLYTRFQEVYLRFSEWLASYEL